jgi:hypothetical protein
MGRIVLRRCHVSCGDVNHLISFLTLCVPNLGHWKGNERLISETSHHRTLKARSFHIPLLVLLKFAHKFRDSCFLLVCSLPLVEWVHP